MCTVLTCLLSHTHVFMATGPKSVFNVELTNSIPPRATAGPREVILVMWQEIVKRKLKIYLGPQNSKVALNWSTQFIRERHGLLMNPIHPISSIIRYAQALSNDQKKDLEYMARAVLLVNSIHPIESDSSTEIVNEPHSTNPNFQSHSHFFCPETSQFIGD